jgi:hypothetical protein
MRPLPIVSAKTILPSGLSIISGRRDPNIIYGIASIKLFLEDRRLRK